MFGVAFTVGRSWTIEYSNEPPSGRREVRTVATQIAQICAHRRGSGSDHQTRRRVGARGARELDGSQKVIVGLGRLAVRSPILSGQPAVR